MTDGTDIEDTQLVEADDGPGIDIEVDAETPTLSRKLRDFLIQLSITVHRFGVYLPGHPSLEPAARGVVDRLGRLLVDREPLAIGVRLRPEGIATDAGTEAPPRPV